MGNVEEIKRNMYFEKVFDKQCDGKCLPLKENLV